MLVLFAMVRYECVALVSYPATHPLGEGHLAKMLVFFAVVSYEYDALCCPTSFTRLKTLIKLSEKQELYATRQGMMAYSNNTVRNPTLVATHSIIAVCSGICMLRQALENYCRFQSIA